MKMTSLYSIVRGKVRKSFIFPSTLILAKLQCKVGVFIQIIAQMSGVLGNLAIPDHVISTIF